MPRPFTYFPVFDSALSTRYSALLLCCSLRDFENPRQRRFRARLFVSDSVALPHMPPYLRRLAAPHETDIGQADGLIGGSATRPSDPRDADGDLRVEQIADTLHHFACCRLAD